MMRSIVFALFVVLLNLRPIPAYAEYGQTCNWFDKALNFISRGDKCAAASAVTAPPDTRTTEEIESKVKELEEKTKKVQKRVDAQKKERKLDAGIKRLEMGKPSEETDGFWKKSWGGLKSYLKYDDRTPWAFAIGGIVGVGVALASYYARAVTLAGAFALGPFVGFAVGFLLNALK